MDSVTDNQTTLADALAMPGDTDAARVTITGAALDSRDVEPGDLFMAVTGSNQSGAAYAGDAVQRGARAIIRDGGGCEPEVDVPVCRVDGLAQHAGSIAARVYGRPSESLFVTGITGTNGKTTCAWLLAIALSRAGQETGYIGTLGAGRIGALTDLRHTTPDAAMLQRECARLRDAGAVAVAAEISSHALAQGRPDAIEFDVAVLTGISRDHLDYHRDHPSYVAAKRRLFEYPAPHTAILNADDAVGHAWLGDFAGRLAVTGYGVDPSLRRLARYVHIERVALRLDGLDVELSTHRGDVAITTRLLGFFNAANIAAVLGVLLARGVSLDDARAALTDIGGAPGRMERVNIRREQPTVVVDYAHTADALTQALIALGEHRGGRLIVVFGCGGERDTGKRSAMGRVATAHADVVIVTDDNPRGEAPEAITAGIVAGLPETAYRIVHDRAEAIAAAIADAGVNDLVLIAGKGHETTQQFGDCVRPFDDRVVARQALEAA